MVPYRPVPPHPRTPPQRYSRIDLRRYNVAQWVWEPTENLGCMMSDHDRPHMTVAKEEVSVEGASLRNMLLGAERGAHHLSDMSKSLERIACALEKIATRLR